MELVERLIAPLTALALVLGVAACGATETPTTPAATQDSENPPPSGEPIPPCSNQVLTPEDCPDLAALLAGPAHGDLVERFVETHHLKTIALDGTIRFLIDSDKAVYSTADIVIGDGDADAATGPVFRITPSSLAPTSTLQQADLAQGMRVRVTAVVGSYYSFEDSATFVPERDARVILASASLERR